MVLPLISPRSECADCGEPLREGTCTPCALRMIVKGGLEEGEWEGTDACGPEDSAQADRYVLKRKLASGGMGVVWEAEDRRLRRTVALKRVRGARFAAEGERARFEIEAAAAAALDHPHIVPVYEVGRLDGQPFFTMKLIDGQSLADRLREHGRLPAREAARLVSKIARAVQHAHSRGVLHRDLKPGNILMDRDGEPWLTDFGLAKVITADSGLTVSHDQLGTPNYMAPEVVRGRAGDVSTASDVWALGVILWELVCGKTPFGGGAPLEVMRRITDEEPQVPSGIKPEADLLTLAQRCLEKPPAARLASPGLLADDLDRWLRGEPIRARAVTRGERFFKWVRRKPTLAALYVALVAGAATGWSLWQRAERVVDSLTETNVHLNDALRISTATKLAGDARLQVEEEPARALLLAAASVEMTELSEFGVLPEAASALMGVLRKVGGFDVSALGVRDAYDDGFQRLSWQEELSVRLSPDNRRVLTICTHGNADPVEGLHAAVHASRDPASRAALHRWRLWPVSAREGVREARWMPDSRHVLALDDSGEVVAWDTDGSSEKGATPPRRVLGSLARPGWKIVWQGLRAESAVTPPCGAVVWRSTQGVAEEMAARVDFPEAGRLVVGPALRWSVAANSRRTFRLSPDGNRLAIIGDGQAQPIRVLNLRAEGISELPDTGESKMYQCVRFSPQGDVLAATEFNERLDFYAVPPAGVREPPRKTHGYDMELGLFTAGHISPDGQWFGVTGRSGAVVLYPTRPGRDPIALHLPSGGGLSLAFSGDGRLLGVGSSDRVACIWRMDALEKGTLPRQLRGMPVVLAVLALSDDGRTVVAGGVEGRAARLWPLDGASEGAVPDYHPAGTYQVSRVATSPDGRWMAAGSWGQRDGIPPRHDGSVTLTSSDGRLSGVLGTHDNHVTGIAFSHDGRWLATTGEDTLVKVWDVAVVERCLKQTKPTPPPVWTLPMAGTRPHFDRSVAFHPRGTLYGSCGDGLLFEWDLSVFDPAAAVHSHGIHSIQYLLPDLKISPDGRWLAVARHGWDKPTPESAQAGNQVLLFNVSEPGPPVFVTALPAHFLEETRLAISPDSRWLAAGSAGYSPDLWDLHAPDIAASRRTAPAPSHSLATAFSPDGRWLALGSNDGTIHLWDWRLGASPRSLQTGAPISSLAWLDNDHLISGGRAPHLAVWDINLARLKALARHVAGRGFSNAERQRFRVSAAN